MNAERWKRRTLPALKTGPVVSSHYEALKDAQDQNDSKTPRVLSRALRSLSNSSLDSLNGGSLRSPVTSTRRLQKTPSSSSSMMERLHRRVSRDSQGSMSPAGDAPGSPSEQSFPSMELHCHGPLKMDVSLLKARSDYLVLTDHCLVRLSSIEAARGIFPQMAPSETLARSGSQQSISGKSVFSEMRFEIPLRSVVAVFKEEGSSPRFGIELWWFSQQPRLAYCKTHLFFSLPKERDDWLSSIQRACRAKFRKSPINSMIPENLRVRINHIVATTESQLVDGFSQNMIFPVAKRQLGNSPKTNANEDTGNQVDGSSFYFVLGPYMCYLVEVLKADVVTPPGDLRVKTSSFGTVTLTRFKASVAAYEQRFFMSFRSPFGRETRLDLASTHYRRIIEALTRMDRILKPMWPQQFQQIIFDIKGLPAPLQLTSGNDLGGVEQSLHANCVALHVDMPRWTIEWHAQRQPTFRLLPLEGSQYSPMQLMAVFRALRYNSFFKAISFRDVDLSSLARKKDFSHYGDSVVHTSLNGTKIPEEHYEHLLQAPILSQELHALAFASESIRKIDLTNVLGVYGSPHTRGSTDYTTFYKNSSELLRPLMMLSRGHLLTCHSFVMSQNPVSPTDIDELANILVLDHVYFRELKMAQCNLGDAGLTKLWTGLSGQSESLEVIDTSDNQGVVRFDVIRDTLAQLRSLRKLNIAGNTRVTPDISIFDEAAIHRWDLEEMDLSGIALNDATIEVIASYLETPKSHNLKIMKLNKCGLTGRQVARLFRSMDQGRKMTVHINANRLDEGIDDLCGAIACGYAPWSLFVQMLEFNYEASFVKLWKALTVNKTIECLSLAGSSTPDAASASACQTVSEFFSNNSTVRYLDISGYDAKLDEGRLGKEFSKALGGIGSNTRIEHLRVRSQMLNVNVGDLAEAISRNSTLHTLDCEDNEFSISNLRHLIKHLTNNQTIRHFSAFSQLELARSVRKSVATAGSSTPTRRNSVMARFRHERSNQGNDHALIVQHLKDEWDATIADLDLILERNQRLGQAANQSDDDDDHVQPPVEHEGEGTFSTSFGGLAIREYQSRHGRTSQSAHTSKRELQDSTKNSNSTINLQGLPGRAEMPLLRSDSTMSSEAVSPTSELSFSSPGENSLEGSPTEKAFSGGPEFPYEENGDEGNMGDMAVSDGGIQMKMYRRTWGDSVGRIDEEEGN